MEHRVNKQRECCRKNTSQKSIGGDCGSGESLERVNEVVERRLENGKEAEAHADEPDHGRDPRGGFLGRPAEDEEPAREEDGANHHWWEAGFGDGFVVVGLEFDDVEFVVAGEWVNGEGRVEKGELLYVG